MTRRRLIRTAVAIPVALVLLLALWVTVAVVVYPAEYVRRVLVWRDSDVWDYLENFPSRALTASPEPFQFESAPDPDRVRAVFGAAWDVDDLDTFLDGTGTQAFIVIHDDRVIYEAYYNAWQRDSLVTSFSVAKSFVSTLVGIAIEEGFIEDIDDPITRYLPELAARDERFERITIRHLLMMSSGLDYQEFRPWWLFNSDDPLTTYHPDQRELSLENTTIAGPPGVEFSYNKYHPQLLGVILERATGMSVTEWTQTRLWDPLGMEFGGSWSLDSTESGFEKMEAGLNGRAIDFAKLGSLFLHDGEWSGRQIVSPEWVALATGIDPAGRAPAWDDERYYALMWWGIERPDGQADFYAAGDHGQYIYVSSSNDVIILRMGVEFGVSFRVWTDAFAQAAGDL